MHELGALTGTLGVHKVDHIGVAVRSIETACTLFVDVLGATFVNGGDDPVLGIRTVQLRLPPGLRFELLQPARDHCYLHGYLAKRGEGVHHITILVGDIHRALAALDDAGYEVVDTDVTSDPTWKQTYLRPRSGHGMLLQIVESDTDWDAPAEGVTLEGVVAGRYLWQGDVAVPREDAEDG